MRWTKISNAPWNERTFGMSASLVDSSLVIAGGYDSWDRFFGDVWRSIDGGISWSVLIGRKTAEMTCDLQQGTCNSHVEIC